MTPFDIIKIINEKNEHDEEEVSASYIPYVVNHGLSMGMDTCFFVEALAPYMSILTVEQQFDFYLHGVPKGKRYNKWVKSEKQSELINIVSAVLQVNNSVSKRYLTLMSEEQKQKLWELEGGNYGRVQSRG